MKRVTCPECHRSISVSRAGVMRYHNYRPDGPTVGMCPGSQRTVGNVEWAQRNRLARGLRSGQD